MHINQAWGDHSIRGINYYRIFNFYCWRNTSDFAFLYQYI
jgi:hypothetical protein